MPPCVQEKPEASYHDFYTRILQTYFPRYMGNLIIDIQQYYNILEDLKGWEVIFTDGSKSKKGVGCAFYQLSNKVSKLFKLGEIVSIFTAEAIAILEALKYFKIHRVTKNLAIMSDSRSVLAGINQRKHYFHTHPIITAIIAESNIIQKGHMVKFFWIKAHSGIHANEMVDGLAKQAAQDGVKLSYDTPKSDLLNFFKGKMLDEWDNNHWKEYYEERRTQYSTIEPTVKFKPWYIKHHIPKKYYVSIARLKFGHGRFLSHLHRIGVVDSPMCMCGAEIGDLNHIFLIAR
ncbi:uncharacterized protein LOC116164019 [Photinus pyralis]|uniref:uncharacterized protein LOC116164019 n=1 Tax=Photinus pyralis TaxID=7054 RepID=UPI0012676675|nr:uncharacterized protein LOC116164019 [Photinus pyralis]